MGVHGSILTPAVAIAAVLLLAGCTPGSGGDATIAPAPSSAAPDTSTAPGMPTPSPAAEPGALPVTVPAEPGDCPRSGDGPVVTYVVTTDDATTPIELTYAAFTAAAVAPTPRTTTVTGPVVTVLQSRCGGDGPESGPWPFTATAPSDTSSFLSCAVFYGGMLIASKTDHTEGDPRDLSVDCTSHPGM